MVSDKEKEHEEEDLENFLKSFNETFDLVITRFLFFSKILKRKFKCKIIYIAPGISSEVFKNIKEKKKAEKISKLEKYYLNYIDEIIVLSNMMKNSLEKLTSKKIIKISPGIDLGKFKVSDLKNNYILFVGRLSKEKNVQALIKAV